MDRYSSCFESHHPATLVVSIRSTLLFSGDMLTIVQSVACTLFGKPWGVYPLKAKPRRNLAPEVSGGGSLFARIPFGAGARHCIGESMALYEMSMHLHRVARLFRLTRAPGPMPALEAMINLRTRDPVYMHLERRRAA